MYQLPLKDKCCVREKNVCGSRYTTRQVFSNDFCNNFAINVKLVKDKNVARKKIASKYACCFASCCLKNNNVNFLLLQWGSTICKG